MKTVNLKGKEECIFYFKKAENGSYCMGLYLPKDKS